MERRHRTRASRRRSFDRDWITWRLNFGAKTGAVVALERRVKEQDKALERARAELEKMREKLLARDDEAFERDLAARSRGRDRSIAAAAEHRGSRGYGNVAQVSRATGGKARS